MGNSTLSDLIDRNQFKGLKHKVVFYNLTTETELLIPELIKLITFGPGVLSLQIPKKTCANGHLLEVFFLPEDDHRKTYNRSILSQIEGIAVIKGKVHDLEPCEDDERFVDVVIELESYDEASYKAVVEKYEQRQGVLDSILKRCKG